MFKKIIYTLLLCASFTQSANAFVSSLFVQDFAQALTSNERDKLEITLSDFERRTGIEIAIITTKTLGGKNLEDEAVYYFKLWGIGKKNENNGILIYAAMEDRKIRMEIGYGLEGLINDAFAGRIIREAIVPYFKEGKYYDGFVSGLSLLTEKLGHPLVEENQTQNTVPLKIRWWHILVILFFIYLFFRHPFLFLLITEVGCSRIGGGGFRGFGGGGGFGGGLSGGGGASGRW